MSHTIELRKVSKYYAGEDTVSMGFSRIDLDLDMGEFVAITGESGSGKSTLLNVISGLDTYEEGEMIVCGEDTTAYGTEEYEAYRKTYIGNIFQDFNLINSYTVYENIELVLLLSGKRKSECKSRVNELIELVGLSEYRNTKASKLSGGQKQRVAIARAMAKDAPIIVADEPTGNLDSASAEAVMETLAKVARDKLVVIVTHNYEQAEPYVTRKLTMHDGKIIEDKRVEKTDTETQASAEQLYRHLEEHIRRQEQDPAGIVPDAGTAGEMKRSSELRLGVRNTFNLPAKFILLFIVYFFVSSAVLSQYTTEINRMHESDLLGSNPYFVNANSDRLIVKKADESSFTDNDFAAIQGIPNVKSIAKNDIAIDRPVSLDLGDCAVEGSVVSSDQINAEEITFGHMPQNDYEIVIRAGAASDEFIGLANRGNEYIGRRVAVSDVKQELVYDFSQDIRIAGIIIDTDTDDDSSYSLYGYSTIYASDAVSNELEISIMAAASTTEFSFGGTRVINDYGRSVYASPNVPDGKVFLLEHQEYYYEDEDADGKDFGIKVKNRFFESEGKYTVDEIITKENCKRLLGIPKGDYNTLYNCVFISNNDYRDLFDKGYYQVSVFLNNEQESDTTKQALSDMGFASLVIKDSLSDPKGDIGSMIDLMTYARLALEFIILFFIAYAVIRLIMRSRNSYYSTLRILGASKSNTGNILRIELVLMMIIAYGMIVLFAVLVNKGILQQLTGHGFKEVTKMLYYLTPLDYGILGALLLLMSLLIANTYSRHIFSKSAMKTFREEV
ncbi:MAG: ABC transporter ATP-binding protein [Firmicutes bacterium]|nr:ABC transporter ATP-binding protein [Bacillota bacterium]